MLFMETKDYVKKWLLFYKFIIILILKQFFKFLSCADRDDDGSQGFAIPESLFSYACHAVRDGYGSQG